SLQLPNSGRNCVDRQPDLRAFERYSRLCAIDTTVLSRPTSFNIAVTNSVRNAESFSNDSPDTAFVLNENLSRDWDNVTRMPRSVGKKIILDFEQSAVRLASAEWDIERLLLKPRYFRDDCYGCESSGTGHEPCSIAHNRVFIDNIRNYSVFRNTILMLAFLLLFYVLFTGSTHVGTPASTPSKRAHYNVFQRMFPSEGSPSKKPLIYSES
ncbi:hypothetical protein Tco_1417323, partial [Tanacetum coccineum]